MANNALIESVVNDYFKNKPTHEDAEWAEIQKKLLQRELEANSQQFLKKHLLEYLEERDHWLQSRESATLHKIDYSGSGSTLHNVNSSGSKLIEKLSNYFLNKEVGHLLNFDKDFSEPIKIDLLINRKQFVGLGFAYGESIAIPNLILKTKIFAPYDKKNRLTLQHKNLAAKNTNFDVWFTGKQCSYNDFYKFFATLDIYLKQSQMWLGVEQEIDLLEICKKMGVSPAGDNPNLVYKTLETLKNNKYKITTYGKKRQTIIHSVGYDIPFSFVKELKKEKNKIKITFDSRIALFYVTASTDMEGKICINKKREIIFRPTYAPCVSGYFNKQEKRLKGFAPAFLFKNLSTNNVIQKLDLKKFKEEFSLKSTIAQLKFKTKKYLEQTNIFSKITFVERNILNFISMSEKKERFRKKLLADYQAIGERCEKMMENKQANPWLILKKTDTAFKRLLKTARANGIHSLEIHGGLYEKELRFEKERQEKIRARVWDVEDDNDLSDAQQLNDEIEYAESTAPPVCYV